MRERPWGSEASTFALRRMNCLRRNYSYDVSFLHSLSSCVFLLHIVFVRCMSLLLQGMWIPRSEDAYTAKDQLSVTNAIQHDASLVYEVREFSPVLSGKNTRALFTP